MTIRIYHRVRDGVIGEAKRYDSDLIPPHKASLYMELVDAGQPSPNNSTTRYTRSLSIVNGQVVASYTAVPTIPEQVSRHAFYIALKRTNRLAAARAWLASLANDDETRMYFEQSPEIRRAHPAIEVLRVGVGATNAQVDALFTAAGNFMDE